MWSYLTKEGQEILKQKIKDEMKDMAGAKKHSVKEIMEIERQLLEHLVKSCNPSFDECVKMLHEFEEALKTCGYEVRRVKVKAMSRALIGFSTTFGKLPFEVGMSFDPIMNSPYIPASTIKGVVRAGVYELLLKKESEDKVEETCNRLFGDNTSIGLLGFTDAYPIEAGIKGYVLFPDVMTPHYTDETGNELEVKPNPISFLTVAPGTVFQFILFYRRQRGSKKIRLSASNDTDLAEDPGRQINALGIVDRGLLYAFYRGVGAKTSMGYSRFEVMEYVRI